MAELDLSMQKIQDLKGRGMNNNQIINELQRQGYSSSQIFDALNDQQYPQQHRPVPPPMPPIEVPSPIQGPGNEELIEAIIDEKWNDLLGDINKVITWKETTESRITKMEQQLTDLKEQFEKLHQAVVGKIGEYDKHILDVGAEVRAMEKVFSKVLPVFTDNVAELSRVTDKLSAKAPKKK